MKWSWFLLLFPLALPAQVLEVSSSALSEGAEQVVGKRAHMTGVSWSDRSGDRPGYDAYVSRIVFPPGEQS